MDEPVSPLDALKPLAGRALGEALNRLLALDPDTAAALATLEGRRIGLALEAPPVALDIRVAGGRLEVGPPTQEPDLGIRATLSGVLSQLPFLRAPDAPPVGRVRVNGDAELARRLQGLARRFDPDWDQPFAELLGPIVGPQVARTLREALKAGARLARGLGRDAVEYLTEESRDLVGKAELSAFLDDVDAVRDRAERLAARIARLEQAERP
ncbi:ubiquinone biosynthesis accessory factor UbiJ [Arenimonas fontis]|uniref:Ubiquinone biosynthesis accessory factor UbiJ n=1 Tax=Arenimonas fontis TaxID=2608255 RepID=A0A5B2Z9N7_9GAMM|nr:SCP2 sterol-binding domain-containing protein [Arenimonas fontis]KAA2284729.1 SCP2 domain-containing protein [Arenimonas fontis]